MENAAQQVSQMPKAEVQQPPPPQQSGGISLDIGILAFVILAAYALARAARALRPMNVDLAAAVGGAAIFGLLVLITPHWTIALMYALPAFGAALIINRFTGHADSEAPVAPKFFEHDGRKIPVISEEEAIRQKNLRRVSNDGA